MKTRWKTKRSVRANGDGDAKMRGSIRRPARVLLSIHGSCCNKGSASLSNTARIIEQKETASRHRRRVSKSQVVTRLKVDSSTHLGGAAQQPLLKPKY